MRLSIIAALGRDRVIGIENRLPWRLPADLRHFKRLTLGKPVLMGRKTYASIGRPLPGRLNLILSRDAAFQPAGCVVVGSVEAARQAAAGAAELMVMGGAGLYEQLLPVADRLYLTLIDAEFAGDAYFPDYRGYHWQELESETHAPDADNPYPYRFVTLERVR